MNLFALSWKNLINKPLNMTLSLILFGLGVGLISLLFILNKQLQEKFDNNLAGIDMVVGAKGSPLQLILSSMYHIDYPTGNIKISEARAFLREGHPLIERSIPLSLGDSYRGYRIVGTTHELADLYQVSVEEGKLWEKEFEVTIGAGVAQDLELKLGDTFKSSHGLLDDGIQVHEDAFKVVGIFAPSGTVLDQLILTSSSSIWNVHAHEMPATMEEEEEHTHEAGDEHEEEGHDHAHEHQTGEAVLTNAALLEHPEEEITSILVKFKNNKNFQALNMPRNINENTDLQAANPAYELNKVRSQLGVGMDGLRVLAYVIVFVSGLSIFISLFSSLKGRKYELALMRVMGATPGKLFLLIILEGLLLAVLGYILGEVISHVSMEVLAYYMKDSYRYDFSGWVFLKEELFIFMGALLIGFLAAVIPALQARRTDISTTLSQG